MKDQKIKCYCGCGRTLYIVDFEDNQICIGSELNARKSFKHFKGVVINKSELFEVLNEDKE